MIDSPVRNRERVLFCTLVPTWSTMTFVWPMTPFGLACVRLTVISTLSLKLALASFRFSRALKLVPTAHSLGGTPGTGQGSERCVETMRRTTCNEHFKCFDSKLTLRFSTVRRIYTVTMVDLTLLNGTRSSVSEAWLT